MGYSIAMGPFLDIKYTEPTTQESLLGLRAFQLSSPRRRSSKLAGC
jgi:hypothetical protein